MGYIVGIPSNTPQYTSTSQLSAVDTSTMGDGFLASVADGYMYMFLKNSPRVANGTTVLTASGSYGLWVEYFLETGNNYLLFDDRDNTISQVSATIPNLTGPISSVGTVTSVTSQTGTGSTFVMSDSPTMSFPTITGSITNSGGGSMVNKNVTANTGTAYNINPTDGKSQVLTLNNNTTLTMVNTPGGTTEREIIIQLVQDATGGRTVTWSGVTWATTGGVAPAINSLPGASTFFYFKGNSGTWTGFAANQNIGVTDGSVAAAGYIGEVISSNVAIGSAVSLTTATPANITSIVLSPGDWMISANVGFIAAAGTLPTILTSSLSQTSATQATSPNGGAYVQGQVAYPAGSTQVMPVGTTRLNVSTTTTVYLVATATFTVSTLTAYGNIAARRFR